MASSAPGPEGPFSPLQERMDIVRRIYWRKASKIAYAAIAFAYALTGFLMSQFGSTKLQQEATLGWLIPRLPALAWLGTVVFLLTIVLIIGVEGAVRDSREMRIYYERKIDALQLRPASPEAAPSPMSRLQTNKVYLNGTALDIDPGISQAISDEQNYEQIQSLKPYLASERLVAEIEQSANTPALECRIVSFNDSVQVLQVQIVSPTPLDRILITLPILPILDKSAQFLEVSATGGLKSRTWYSAGDRIYLRRDYAYFRDHGHSLEPFTAEASCMRGNLPPWKVDFQVTYDLQLKVPAGSLFNILPTNIESS
jgi:hypothetical protein